MEERREGEKEREDRRKEEKGKHPRVISVECGVSLGLYSVSRGQNAYIMSFYVSVDLSIHPSRAVRCCLPVKPR